MADTPQDVTEAPIVDAPAPDMVPERDPVMDILTEGTEDPNAKAEPSTAKDDKASEAEDTKEEVQADDTATTPDVPTKDDSEEAAPADDSETEVQPNSKAEDRKQVLNTEIRDLVAQRNALKTDIEKINAEFYQPATEEQLVESGLTPTDAKIEALNQRLEVRDYNERVAEAQLTIESESQRVLREFPMFNPESKEAFNKELAATAAELFNESIIRDENTGQVIGTTIPPYKLYKALASSYNVSSEAGQIKGQRATQEMLARADSTPDAAPKTEKKDPILAILEDVDGD